MRGLPKRTQSNRVRKQRPFPGCGQKEMLETGAEANRTAGFGDGAGATSHNAGRL